MIAENDKVVLQFSGGKDSLACLYLLRDYWDRITVLWVNTGDAFPETIEQMRKVKEMVSTFVEVKSDQPKNISDNGYPADLVNAWTAPWWKQFDSFYSYRAQSPFTCCGENIWRPMAQKTAELGATLVIRGQRNSEQKKSTLRNGDMVDGVTYWLPLQDWSDADVKSFLETQGVKLPEHYGYVNTSLDCRHCTAYLSENSGKFRYIKEKHPELFKEVQGTLQEMLKRVADESSRIYEAMTGG